MAHISRTGLKTTALAFRVSNSEHALIQCAAADCAMSVSEYCRSQTLGKTITHRVDIEAIAELRRQGGLLKQLHHQGIGHEAEIAKAVKVISELVNGLFQGFQKT